MITSLAHHIRALAPDGLQMHIWPRQGGGYQVSVSEPGFAGWTVEHDDDPVAGLTEALRLRVGGVAGRTVEALDGIVGCPVVDVLPGKPDARQTDLEDAIAAVSSDDDFEGLL